jgi:hypothetical protein
MITANEMRYIANQNTYRIPEWVIDLIKRRAAEGHYCAWVHPSQYYLSEGVRAGLHALGFTALTYTNTIKISWEPESE